MDISAQELANQAEQLAINPENPIYSTNWCHLPMEMRLECIKWMNFETRTRLGATSHTEKSLVEAKKYHFDSVTLAYCSSPHGSLELTVENRGDSESIHRIEQTMNFFGQIMKNCQIDTFELSSLEYSNELQIFWPKLKKNAPFRFKTFKSTSYEKLSARLFLEYSEGVENVILDNGKSASGREPMIDLVRIPQVANAKLFQVSAVCDFGKVNEVLKNWINNNAEIGKSLRFERDFKALYFFDSAFTNRLVYQKDGEIRIRTNAESKHILIRCSKRIRDCFRFWCTVIPSNLLESEYEKDEWLGDMEEKTSNDEFCKIFIHSLTYYFLGRNNPIVFHSNN